MLNIYAITKSWAFSSGGTENALMGKNLPKEYCPLGYRGWMFLILLCRHFFFHETSVALKRLLIMCVGADDGKKESAHCSLFHLRIYKSISLDLNKKLF
jgi:hypothetical protein